MKRWLLVLLLLIAYFFTTHALAKSMQDRPILVRLGYTPAAEIQRLIAGEFRLALSESAVVRVLFYFGSLIEQWRNQVMLPPEYFNMYKTIETAVKLDPYNKDAYYFAQSAFTWEVGRVREVNALLEYGMRFRDKDWELPYFLGFNLAYFMHEYEEAAECMQRAADLSGQPLFASLASRYFYEAGRTEFGIRYLEGMIRQERDVRQKQSYQMRLDALLATRKIETARLAWEEKYGKIPTSLKQLLDDGFLSAIPADPYGGTFFLDEEGHVRTTSKFALKSRDKDRIDASPKSEPKM